MIEPHFGVHGEEIKEPFHYKGCGLDGIYLINGYKIHETEYGKGVSIKNLDGLLDAIAEYVVEGKKVLGGKEIRFLRLRMDITQSEMGRLLGMSAQQVARWEKDQSQIPGPADRLLRVIYTHHIGRSFDLRDLLKCLDEQDAPMNDKAVFINPDENGDGWKRAA